MFEAKAAGSSSFFQPKTPWPNPVNFDWSIRHIGEESPTVFLVLDFVFTIVFAIELLFRILASGVLWFVNCRNRELNWNVFDAALVSCSILEAPILLLLGSSINLTAARLLRLMRLVRMLRMVRLFRFFKQLRVVVQTVAASLKPLAWALILLVVVIYLSSIVVLQLINDNSNEGLHSNEVKCSHGSCWRLDACSKHVKPTAIL